MCVPRVCMPTCAADEYCAGAECLSCDGDDDGFFADARQCDELRGEAPPDCDDADRERFPGTPVVCGNGAIDGCPDPLADTLRGSLGAAELGYRRPFDLDMHFMGGIHPPIHLVNAPLTVDGTPSEGMVVYGRDATRTPVAVFYEADGSLGFRPLSDLLVDTPATGTQARWAADAVAGQPVIAAATVPVGGGPQMSIYAGSTPPLAATVGPKLFQGPASESVVLRTLDGGNPDAVWSEARSGQPSLVSMGTWTTHDEIQAGPGAWLRGDGPFVLSPTVVSGMVALSDLGRRPFYPIELEAGGDVVGRPDVAVLDGVTPTTLVAVVPTSEGLMSATVACDTTTCSTTDISGPAGAGHRSRVAMVGLGEQAAILVSRPAALGEHVSLMLVRPDGFVPAGTTPILLPAFTSRHLGEPFTVQDLDATVETIEGGLRLRVAVLLEPQETGGNAIYMAGVDVCYEE